MVNDVFADGWMLADPVNPGMPLSNEIDPDWTFAPLPIGTFVIDPFKLHAAWVSGVPLTS
jgi:hypothetical protein